LREALTFAELRGPRVGVGAGGDDLHTLRLRGQRRTNELKPDLLESAIRGLSAKARP
jgi:hypothetical protein